MNTYCSKSWTDVNINFSDRTVRHCCKSAPYIFPETLTVDFLNNSSQIQERRAQSLIGIAHPDCASCWTSIKETGTSYRDWMNQWDETDIDKYQSHLTQPIIQQIEVELDNTCDMACLYCFPDNSSKIAQEENVVIKSKFNQHDYDIFKQWVSSYLSQTDHLHDAVLFNFLGGEPTASKRFYDLVEFIEAESKKTKLEITIAICTNANTKPHLMRKLAACINRSDLIWSIAVSNEGFKQDAELVRHGLVWDRFSENVKFYMSHPKITTFALSPTLNALNLKSFPEYVVWVHNMFDTHGTANKIISWCGNFVDYPTELDIAQLPKSFINYIDTVLEFVLKYKSNARYSNLDQFDQFLNSMKQRIGSIHNQNFDAELTEFVEHKQRVKQDNRLSNLLKNIK